jgi:hypothetical protein
MRLIKSVKNYFLEMLEILKLGLFLFAFLGGITGHIFRRFTRTYRLFVKLGYFTKAISIVTIVCLELSTLWTSGYSTLAEDRERRRLLMESHHDSVSVARMATVQEMMYQKYRTYFDKDKNQTYKFTPNGQVAEIVYHDKRVVAVFNFNSEGSNTETKFYKLNDDGSRTLIKSGPSLAALGDGGIFSYLSKGINNLGNFSGAVPTSIRFKLFEKYLSVKNKLDVLTGSEKKVFDDKGKLVKIDYYDTKGVLTGYTTYDEKARPKESYTVKAGKDELTTKYNYADTVAKAINITGIIVSRTMYSQGIAIATLDYVTDTVTHLSGGKPQTVTLMGKPDVVVQTYNYDKTGTLVSSVDNRTGNTTNYKNGREDNITDSSGFVLSEYQYNSKGSLTTVTNFGFAEDKITRIAISRTVYDAGKVLRAESNSAAGWVTTLDYIYAKGTNNLVATQEYSYLDNGTKVAGNKTYYMNGRQSYVKNAEGAVVQRYVYDATGSLKQVNTYDNNTQTGYTTYDRYGRPNKIYSVTDGNATLKGEYTYNDTGKTVDVTNNGVTVHVGSGGCLNSQTYTNDANGNVSQTTETLYENGNINTPALTYLKETGEILSKTEFVDGIAVATDDYVHNTRTVLSGGKPLKVTQLDNSAVVLNTYNYNMYGTLDSTIDNYGIVTTYTNGRPDTITNSDGFITSKYSYNSNGSLVAVTNFGVMLDKNNNVVKNSDGSAKSYELSKTIYEAGKIVRVEGNSQQTEEVTKKDAAGNIVYDTNGKEVKESVKLWNADGTPKMATHIQMTYEYAKGTNTLISTQEYTDDNVAGNKTYYENGRAAYVLNDKGAKITEYVYNSNGSLNQLNTYTDGKLTLYITYDKYGRQNEMYTVDGGITKLLGVNEYNDTGKVISVSTPDGKVTVNVGMGACKKSETYSYLENGEVYQTTVSLYRNGNISTPAAVQYNITSEAGKAFDAAIAEALKAAGLSEEAAAADKSAADAAATAASNSEKLAALASTAQTAADQAAIDANNAAAAETKAAADAVSAANASTKADAASIAADNAAASAKSAADSAQNKANSSAAIASNKLNALNTANSTLSLAQAIHSQAEIIAKVAKATGISFVISFANSLLAAADIILNAAVTNQKYAKNAYTAAAATANADASNAKAAKSNYNAKAATASSAKATAASAKATAASTKATAASAKATAASTKAKAASTKAAAASAKAAAASAKAIADATKAAAVAAKAAAVATKAAADAAAKAVKAISTKTPAKSTVTANNNSGIKIGTPVKNQTDLTLDDTSLNDVEGIKSVTIFVDGIAIATKDYENDTVTNLSGGKPQTVTQMDNPSVILNTYNYNKYGTLESTVDNYGNLTDFKNGRPQSVTNNEGFVVTKYDYSSSGVLTTITNFGLDDKGKRVALNRMVYDAGKVVKEEVCTDSVWSTKVTYNYIKGTSVILNTQDANGNKTYYVNGKPSYATNAQGAITQTYKYDNQGGLKQVNTLSDGRVTGFTQYDRYGRVTDSFEVTTDGTVSKTTKTGSNTYNDTGKTVDVTHDGVTVHVASGGCLNTETYKYDANGNISETQVSLYNNGNTNSPAALVYIKNAGSSTSNAVSAPTIPQNSQYSDLISQTVFLQGIAIQSIDFVTGKVSNLSGGKPVNVTQLGSPNIVLETFTYDKNGTLLSSYDVLSQETTHYNTSGQATEITTTDPDGTVFVKSKYNYNSNGTLTDVTNYGIDANNNSIPTSRTIYAYGKVIKQESYTASSGIWSTSVEYHYAKGTNTLIYMQDISFDESGNKVLGSSTYYDKGQPSYVVSAQGKTTVKYEYNNNGSLKQVKTFDTDGLPTGYTTYDQFGRPLDTFEISTDGTTTKTTLSGHNAYNDTGSAITETVNGITVTVPPGGCMYSDSYKQSADDKGNITTQTIRSLYINGNMNNPACVSFVLTMTQGTFGSFRPTHGAGSTSVSGPAIQYDAAGGKIPAVKLSDPKNVTYNVPANSIVSKTVFVHGIAVQMIDGVTGKVTNLSGGKPVNVTLNGSVIETFSYNNFGSMVSSLDILSGETTHYNTSGQPDNVTKSDGFVVTKFNYNANGTLTDITNYGLDGKNNSIPLTRTVYKYGKVWEQDSYTPSGVWTKSVSYNYVPGTNTLIFTENLTTNEKTYFKDGQPSYVTNAAGKIISSFTYNPNGSLIQADTYTDDGVLNGRTTYDQFGRPTDTYSVTNGNFTRTGHYDYNDSGKPLTTTIDGVTITVPSGGCISLTSYDCTGKKTTVSVFINGNTNNPAAIT